MNIDIDDKEARVLLNALRMYRAQIQEEAEELAEIEAAREERKHKSQPVLGCGCCIDFTEQKLKVPYYRDDKFCIQLRNKLKMHQMKFPLEEHSINMQYGYDKKIGYEGAKWAETLESVGLPPD